MHEAIKDKQKHFYTSVKPMYTRDATPVQLSRRMKTEEKTFLSPIKPMLKKRHTSVHWQMKTKESTYTG